MGRLQLLIGVVRSLDDDARAVGTLVAGVSLVALGALGYAEVQQRRVLRARVVNGRLASGRERRRGSNGDRGRLTLLPLRPRVALRARVALLALNQAEVEHGGKRRAGVRHSGRASRRQRRDLAHRYGRGLSGRARVSLVALRAVLARKALRPSLALYALYALRALGYREVEHRVRGVAGVRDLRCRAGVSGRDGAHRDGGGYAGVALVALHALQPLRAALAGVALGALLAPLALVALRALLSLRPSLALYALRPLLALLALVALRALGQEEVQNGVLHRAGDRHLRGVRRCDGSDGEVRYQLAAVEAVVYLLDLRVYLGENLVELVLRLVHLVKVGAHDAAGERDVGHAVELRVVVVGEEVAHDVGYGLVGWVDHVVVADLVRLDVNLLLLVWVENLVDLRAQRREVGHFQDLVQSAREGVRNPVAEIDGCSVLVYQHLALLQSDVASIV